MKTTMTTMTTTILQTLMNRLVVITQAWHCLQARKMTNLATLGIFRRMASQVVQTSHSTMRRMALGKVKLQQPLLHLCLQQAFQTG